MLVIVLTAFALLAGVYYMMRFASWSMEGDASSQTTSAIGMLESGQVDYPGAYNNGFGYSAQLVLLNLVTGLQVQQIQLGSSLWVFALALVAFITYREFLGSAIAAALGAMLLFLQPDFLFYAVRGSHEKFIWTYALLLMFLLVRSYSHIHNTWKFLLYVGLFYMVFWAFVSTNVYFAAVFMVAIMLSFVGGWVLSQLDKKHLPTYETRTPALERLIVISLACSILVFIFINYTYWPALLSYNLISDLSDKLSLMMLGAQPVETPSAYQSLGMAWKSQGAYLVLTAAQWIITLTSLVAWVIGLIGLSRMDQKRWLLWLMYSAFGLLMIFGVVADLAGFMSTNLQLRMFTPFAIFSSALVADLVVRRIKAMNIRWRKLVSVAIVIIIAFGALTVNLKVTNEPVFGNQWLFYTPEELAPARWFNNHGVLQQQVWVDTSEHLSKVYYFWEGVRPIIPYQYKWGERSSSAPYTLISELARLRTNRSGITLPYVEDQNQIYDNGQVQIFHRLPQTPYQH